MAFELVSAVEMLVIGQAAGVCIAAMKRTNEKVNGMAQVPDIERNGS